MCQRLLYVLSFQFSKLYEVGRKGTLTFVLQIRMLRCTEVKKLAPRDRAGNELTRRPIHIFSSHLQMPFTPPFPAAVSQRGHSHLPQQTKSSKRISVSRGQRPGIGTPKILTPFHIQAIFLRSNLVCLSSDLIPNNLRTTVLFHIRVYHFSFGKLFTMVRFKPQL